METNDDGFQERRPHRVKHASLKGAVRQLFDFVNRIWAGPLSLERIAERMGAQHIWLRVGPKCVHSKPLSGKKDCQRLVR